MRGARKHPWLESFAQALAPLARAANELGAWVVQNQEFIRAFNAYAVQSLENVQAQYSALVEGESIQTLMKHGWYPDPGWSLMGVKLLAEAFDDEDPERASQASGELCETFRDRLDDIETRLRGEFPNRSEILSDVFQAHRQGHYNLSVVVFLTQADGFLFDRWMKNLFLSRDRNDIDEQIKLMPNELTRTLSRALLSESWPLAMSQGLRQRLQSGFTELNRHQVLHGEVTGYGTEENSLKAISLLNFCAFVLPQPATGADAEQA